MPHPTSYTVSSYITNIRTHVTPHLARRSAWLSGAMALEVGAAACGMSTTRDVVHVPNRLMLAADGADVCVCVCAFVDVCHVCMGMNVRGRESDLLDPTLWLLLPVSQRRHPLGR